MKKKAPILGAAFLMATSAIGPGFLTQTAKFTADLATSFGFVILISFVIDMAAQVNIWRIVAVSKSHAQDIANKVFPGLGTLLAVLIGFGGLVFNIGNIGGCGLGLNALMNMNTYAAAILSCVIALAIFWYKEAGQLMDGFTKLLGLLMILLTVYIAFSSHPPLAEALHRTILPQKIDTLEIITLVGGTIGGYISFAGAHRLLDAGISGKEFLPQVTKSSLTGIFITSFMRYILFLAVLGVVWHGSKLNSSNPAASAFQLAAGNLGYRFFGFVMWCAAITSVVGASYTSVSFFKTLHPFIENNQRIVISLFIIASTIIYISIGNPVTLLIMAGGVNGLILPIALAVILIAAVKVKIIGDYKHPLWLQAAGWVIVAVMIYMGVIGVAQSIKTL